MQIHFNETCFGRYGTPRLNVANPDDPFAILPAGPLELSILDEEEAGQLIAVACQIKDMFRQHTLMRSPIWAVVDRLEGEVSGDPMTHADAEQWISDNGSFFIGDLAIEPAAPGLDAKLSPDAGQVLRDAHGPNAQITPPGHQLPAGVVPGRDDPLPPYHAEYTGSPYCQARDDNDEFRFTCTAQEGHAGPLHITYGVDGKPCHSWPVSDVPAGTDAS